MRRISLFAILAFHVCRQTGAGMTKGWGECYAGAMLKSGRQSLWYAFAFLLPWQTVWIAREVFVGGEKWQYATFGIYASDVALLACAVFFVFGARREVWRVVVRDRVVFMLGSLLLWTLLSSLWSIDASLALISAWKIFLMTLVFVLARYGGVSTRKTISIFLVSMAIQASLALLQWGVQHVSPSTLLGIAGHEAWQPGTSVLKTDGWRFLRAYGGFEHPNVSGGALAMAILLGVWISATTRRSRLRVGFLVMAVLSGFALVVTFSRSAWMALGCGGIVLFLGLINPWRDMFALRKIARRLMVGLFFVGVSCALGFLAVRDVAMTRFSGETLAREGSLSDRAVYMEQAMAAIREHPIRGAGGGNFTAFTMQRFPGSGSFVGAFQPVHAVPVLIFAELGAVGFVLVVSLFLCSIVFAWKRKDIFSVAILCTLLSMLLLDHWLWSGHFGMIFLGLLLGLRVRDDAASSQKGCLEDEMPESAQNRFSGKRRKA